MPKNLRCASILLTLCLASLISFIWPSLGVKGGVNLIGSARPAAASAGDGAMRQVSNVRPAAGLLPTGGVGLSLISTISGQLAGQGAAQEPAGVGGQAAQVSTANALAADVAVTDRKMTAGPLPANCVAPLAR